VWVTRLAAELQLLGDEHGIDAVVQNPSVNGNTTRQALERMAFDVQSHAPDVLVVQFGMNDCNYWPTDGGHPRVSSKAFAANLEEIVARGRTFGARSVLLLTNHPTTRDGAPMLGTELTYEESNRRYNGIIRTVAAEAGPVCRLVDIEAAFRAAIERDVSLREQTLAEDRVHLALPGHELYVEIVGPVLREVVLEVARLR
jgi:lysophospholipase L1-like esterase